VPARIELESRITMQQTEAEKIGFIGGGNMAAALIGGLIQDGVAPQRILVTDPNAARQQYLASHYGVHTGSDNLAVARQADLLVLAVKPQVLNEVAQTLAPALAERDVPVISIAAGVRTGALQQWLGSGVPLIRAMPNTPAMVQTGATALFAAGSVGAGQRDAAERVMRAVGLTLWIEDEDLMDAVTAVSGSGPAYFFLFMEAMMETAEQLGLPTATAQLLTLQTALGAARMAMESDEGPASLRQRVTSPGGTTEQAIRQFEQGGLRNLIRLALTAARDRSQELSNPKAG